VAGSYEHRNKHTDPINHGEVHVDEKLLAFGQGLRSLGGRRLVFAHEYTKPKRKNCLIIILGL